MNSPHNFKKFLLLTGSLLLIFIFHGVGLSAQDQPPKKEKSGKKTVKVQVVTDENGKVTKFDTTYSTEGDKGITYEYTIRDLEDQMKDLEDQMKQMEVVISDTDLEDLDSVMGNDSIVKKIIIRAPRVHMGDMPGCHMFMGDVPCPPMPPSWDDEEGNFFNTQTLPPQWQALLGSIPLGNITGFKVVEKKGGKRIIIDMDDNPVMVVMPYQHRHGRGQPKIIIEKNVQVPEPPAPPAPEAPEKPQGKKG